VGQKTHPKAFRLVTTQSHLSKWYSPQSLYAQLAKEDYLIRKKIETELELWFPLSKIEINRISSKDNSKNQIINISIFALYPRAKEFVRNLSRNLDLILLFDQNKILTLLNQAKGNELKKLVAFLIERKIRNIIRELQIECEKEIYFELNFLKNRFEDAMLIGKYIGEQLKKRIPFRRAIKQTIKKVTRTTKKGIKIEVSGRLNGVEIARTEWKREGRVPLHTLRANIDYIHHGVETIYGIMGIKVWLFHGEESN
jgi:small subunit ribosomal protein S3